MKCSKRILSSIERRQNGRALQSVAQCFVVKLDVLSAEARVARPRRSSRT